MEDSKVILVVENEPEMAENIHSFLSLEGYRVETRCSGLAGLQAAKSLKPDLILLDVNLPEFNGFEVCEKVKSDHKLSQIPIIMVTGRSEETDVVKALELGADDYVTKPFSLKILSARMKTALKKTNRPKVGENEEELEFHEVRINTGKREVQVDGERVDLTDSEFRILYFMLSEPGWVFTRAQIVEGVRGDHYSVNDRAIDVQMVGLRKKLGSFARRIQTVRGVGYRIKE